jgi:hypothetical protein
MSQNKLAPSTQLGDDRENLNDESGAIFRGLWSMQLPTSHTTLRTSNHNKFGPRYMRAVFAHARRCREPNFQSGRCYSKSLIRFPIRHSNGIIQPSLCARCLRPCQAMSIVKFPIGRSYSEISIRLLTLHVDDIIQRRGHKELL